MDFHGLEDLLADFDHSGFVKSVLLGSGPSLATALPSSALTHAWPPPVRCVVGLLSMFSRKGNLEFPPAFFRDSWPSGQSQGPWSKPTAFLGQVLGLSLP